MRVIVVVTEGWPESVDCEHQKRLNDALSPYTTYPKPTVTTSASPGNVISLGGVTPKYQIIITTTVVFW